MQEFYWGNLMVLSGNASPGGGPPWGMLSLGERLRGECFPWERVFSARLWSGATSRRGYSGARSMARLERRAQCGKARAARVAAAL